LQSCDQPAHASSLALHRSGRPRTKTTTFFFLLSNN
jgi:hypothetical protein